MDVGKWCSSSVVPRDSDLIRVAIAEGGIGNVTESDKFDEDCELLKF